MIRAEKESRDNERNSGNATVLEVVRLIAIEQLWDLSVYLSFHHDSKSSSLIVGASPRALSSHILHLDVP